MDFKIKRLIQRPEKERDVVLYIHGKGGNAQEAGHYENLFPECDIVGMDYKKDTPWETRTELLEQIKNLSGQYGGIILIANSIGAFFAMNALSEEKIKTAFFISPVVDMEKLITDMLQWANTTEKELKEQKIIETEFGETLSWEYLDYVRKNPIKWDIPTQILYGEKDHLTSLETVKVFAEKHGAGFTIMKDGEHWFHTDEQMDFLDKWIMVNYEE